MLRCRRETRLCFVITIFVWNWSVMLTTATWWWLNVVPPRPDQELNSERYCGSFPLTKNQREICNRHPRILSKVSEGIRDAIAECQNQMQHKRWNCSLYIDFRNDPKRHVFEPIMKQRGKERAFIQALFSASISHAITRSCTLDKLPNDCGCAVIPVRRKNSRGEWGGCSDDLHFGDGLSASFMDDVKNRKSSSSQLDLHNNAIGRQTVLKYNHTKCKCHGLSGACTQNICWVSLPTMREVGRRLREKYDDAVQVKYKKGKFRSSSFGTTGRICNSSSAQSDGCKHMCCGRNFTTEVVRVRYNCNCTFQYCCHLSCEICERDIQQSRCR